MAEQDLSVLLRNMEPVLTDLPYGYAVWPGETLPSPIFATVAESEGLTVVAPWDALVAAGVDQGSIAGPWARISLTVHSDLAAVGLTAAFSSALAAEGISANVIAGFFHDHIFVAWERRFDAVAALKALSVV